MVGVMIARMSAAEIADLCELCDSRKGSNGPMSVISRGNLSNGTDSPVLVWQELARCMRDRLGVSVSIERAFQQRGGLQEADAPARHARKQECPLRRRAGAQGQRRL